MCISREEIGGQLSRRKRVSRYIYIIPIAKVLISHFRYNETGGIEATSNVLNLANFEAFPWKKSRNDTVE